MGYEIVEKGIIGSSIPQNDIKGELVGIRIKLLSLMFSDTTPNNNLN